MSTLKDQLTADRQITSQEVSVIRRHIQRDGQLDLDDVRFLVELLVKADSVCSEFDELFFPVLRDVVLRDGRVGQDEQFYLLKMIYGDGRIRSQEREFLGQLLREATDPTPEFLELCRTALQAPDENWDLGG